MTFFSYLSTTVERTEIPRYTPLETALLHPCKKSAKILKTINLFILLATSLVYVCTPTWQSQTSPLCSSCDRL